MIVNGQFLKGKQSEKWKDEGLIPKAMKLINKMCKLVGSFVVNPYLFGKLYEVTLFIILFLLLILKKKHVVVSNGN